MSSLFTKIINGELPSEKLYETKSELAFLDINPKAEGHTLVIPKLEVASFEDLPQADMHSLISSVQVVTRGIVRAMHTPHYNLVLNNGAPAGQVIFHVHFHVIPRYEGAGRGWASGSYKEGRMAEVGATIRDAIKALN